MDNEDCISPDNNDKYKQNLDATSAGDKENNEIEIEQNNTSLITPPLIKKESKTQAEVKKK